MLWPKKKYPDLNTLPTTLEGFRVILRPPVASDWQNWAETRARNKAYLVPFEPRWPAQALTADFFKKRLARQHKDWEKDRGYSFLIFDKQTGQIIGGVNINHVCRGAAQNATLGYWIDQERQGEGLMAESLRLIIRYAFDHLKLHRLNAACMPHNERSIALLLKLGFIEEGFAKAFVQINNAWEDHILFGLVESHDLDQKNKRPT